MKLLPLNRLGARETSPGVVEFGVLLPGISPAGGTTLTARIIHERDQFLQDVPPLEFALSHTVDLQYGDYWSARIGIDPAQRPTSTSAWGTPGTYVYRYQLASPLLAKLLRRLKQLNNNEIF